MFSLPRWLRGHRPVECARGHSPRKTKLHLEQLEDRSVPATISAASSSAVFLIHADKSVWEYSSSYGWLQLTSPGFAQSISAVHETSTGNDVVFALTTNGWLYEYHLGAPWTLLGGYFTFISAGLDANGNSEVFAITNGDVLYEFDLSSFGVRALGSDIKYVSTGGGAETVFAVLTDGSISEHTSNGWTQIASSGSASEVDAVTTSSGTTVYLMNEQGFIYENTGGASWASVIGQAGSFSAGTDANGNAALFVIAGFNGGLSLPTLYEFSSQANGQDIGNYQDSISATDSDFVFATLSDHSVWYHTTAGGWVNLAPAGTALD
jgi:hypothetical protein